MVTLLMLRSQLYSSIIFAMTFLASYDFKDIETALILGHNEQSKHENKQILIWHILFDFTSPVYMLLFLGNSISSFASSFQSL